MTRNEIGGWHFRWQTHITVGVAILAVASSAFSVQAYRNANVAQLKVNAIQRYVNANQLVLNTQSCFVRRTLSEGQVTNLTNLVASSNEFRHITTFTPAERVFFETSFKQRTVALAKAKYELLHLKC